MFIGPAFSEIQVRGKTCETCIISHNNINMNSGNVLIPILDFLTFAWGPTLAYMLLAGLQNSLYKYQHVIILIMVMELNIPLQNHVHYIMYIYTVRN